MVIKKFLENRELYIRKISKGKTKLFEFLKGKYNWKIKFENYEFNVLFRSGYRIYLEAGLGLQAKVAPAWFGPLRKNIFQKNIDHKNPTEGLSIQKK